MTWQRWDDALAAYYEEHAEVLLDAEVHGPGPGGFHATNVLLHALNAALVFGLLRRWTGRTGASCAGRGTSGRVGDSV